MTTGAWRTERNHKMHFCVARDVAGEKEVLKSASGKASSFRTWAAAERARKNAAAAAEERQ